MIGNDFGRSLEFVKSPALAGQQAKALPYSFQTIIAIFVLCAILSVLTANALGQVIPIDAADLDAPEDATAFESQVFEMMKLSLDFFRSNPIVTVIISAAMNVLASVLLFVVGRNFVPSIDLLESQSALARFELVRTVFISALQGVAILFWMMSATMGSAFTNVVTICGMVLLLLKIHVIRGIFEVESFGKAFIIWILSILCLIGVGFFASLIFTVIML